MNKIEEEKRRLAKDYHALEKNQEFLEEKIISTEERLGGV